MTGHAIVVPRRGALAVTATVGVAILGIIGWIICMVAVAFDSLLVATVVVTTLLLPPAYGLAKLGGQQRR
jgi:hypothetical protein